MCCCSNLPGLNLLRKRRSNNYLYHKITVLSKTVSIPGCLCLCCMLLVSCSKSTGPSLQHNEITGKWRKTRSAIDTNGNGKMDPIELLAPDSYDSTHVFVFNSDGSGQIIYQNLIAGSFSWSLENKNSYLRMSYPGTSAAPTLQHMDTLTTTAMTLKDTTGSRLSWSLYNKQ